MRSSDESFDAFTSLVNTLPNKGQGNVFSMTKSKSTLFQNGTSAMAVFDADIITDCLKD